MTDADKYSKEATHVSFNLSWQDARQLNSRRFWRKSEFRFLSHHPQKTQSIQLKIGALVETDLSAAELKSLMEQEVKLEEEYLQLLDKFLFTDPK